MGNMLSGKEFSIELKSVWISVTAVIAVITQRKTENKSKFTLDCLDIPTLVNLWKGAKLQSNIFQQRFYLKVNSCN